MRRLAWLVVVAAACGGRVQVDAAAAGANGAAAGGAAAGGTAGSSGSGGTTALAACPPMGATSDVYLALEGQRCASESASCIGGCGLECSCQSPNDDGEATWHCSLHSCILLEPTPCPDDPSAVSRIDQQYCDLAGSTCGGCGAGVQCTCHSPVEDALPTWDCVGLGCSPR